MDIKKLKKKMAILAMKHKVESNPELKKSLQITITMGNHEPEEEKEEKDEGEHETRSLMDSPKKKKLDLSGFIKK